MHLFRYIAELERKGVLQKRLAFDIRPSDKDFFRHLTEYALNNEIFYAREIERYLKRKRSKEEMIHYVQKRKAMKHPHVNKHFKELANAGLIVKVEDKLLPHARARPFKISPLGWLYFWAMLRIPFRSYFEILKERYDSDPIVEAFIQPYFEKKTVQSLIHSTYVIDEYLSPGSFQPYLEKCCRDLISDLQSIRFSEEFFKARVRYRAKMFILEEILFMGREPVSFSILGKWKDKNLERYQVRSEIEAIRSLGHKKGSLLRQDRKFMTVLGEIRDELGRAMLYFVDSQKKNKKDDVSYLLAPELAKVNPS